HPRECITTNRALRTYENSGRIAPAAVLDRWPPLKRRLEAYLRPVRRAEVLPRAALPRTAFFLAAGREVAALLARASALRALAAVCFSAFSLARASFSAFSSSVSTARFWMETRDALACLAASPSSSATSG